MTASIIMALAFASVLAGYETKRAFACMAVLWVTVASLAIHESSLYFPLSDTFGYYGLQALDPLLSIIILANIRCRLSSCLMVLFCVLISVNIIAWYIEGLGINVEAYYQQAVWVVFIIELALMFSERLTNVVHGVVHRPSVAGDTSAPIVAFEHLDYSAQSNTSEVEK
jgi:hypothetical protein